MPRTKAFPRSATTPTLEKPMNLAQSHPAQNGNGSAVSKEIPQETEKSDESSLKARSGNIFTRALRPEWRTNPEPLDFVDGMLSNEFILAKVVRTIIEPLGLVTDREEWMKVADESWIHAQQKEERLADEQADDMISVLAENNLLYKRFMAKLQAIS